MATFISRFADNNSLTTENTHVKFSMPKDLKYSNKLGIKCCLHVNNYRHSNSANCVVHDEFTVVIVEICTGLNYLVQHPIGLRATKNVSYLKPIVLAK
jgi:hypothetical protein